MTAFCFKESVKIKGNILKWKVEIKFCFVDRFVFI